MAGEPSGLTSLTGSLVIAAQTARMPTPSKTCRAALQVRKAIRQCESKVPIVAMRSAFASRKIRTEPNVRARSHALSSFPENESRGSRHSFLHQQDRPELTLAMAHRKFRSAVDR